MLYLSKLLFIFYIPFDKGFNFSSLSVLRTINNYLWILFCRSADYKIRFLQFLVSKENRQIPLSYCFHENAISADSFYDFTFNFSVTGEIIFFCLFSFLYVIFASKEIIVTIFEGSRFVFVRTATLNHTPTRSAYVSFCPVAAQFSPLHFGIFVTGIASLACYDFPFEITIVDNICNGAIFAVLQL